jgi:hypothetical protein
MTRSHPQALRILSIDPIVPGVGFVVLEGQDNLIDWGIKLARGERNAACLRIVEALILRYKPNIIVVENCQAKGCSRGQRAKDLIEDIAAIAKARRIKCRSVARLAVHKAFSKFNAFTKHERAVELVTRFPELTRHLPRARKPWMSEDIRMSIFDAAAFALILLLT